MRDGAGHGAARRERTTISFSGCICSILSTRQRKSVHLPVPPCTPPNSRSSIARSTSVAADTPKHLSFQYVMFHTFSRVILGTRCVGLLPCTACAVGSTWLAAIGLRASVAGAQTDDGRVQLCQEARRAKLKTEPFFLSRTLANLIDFYRTPVRLHVAVLSRSPPTYNMKSEGYGYFHRASGPSLPAVEPASRRLTAEEATALRAAEAARAAGQASVWNAVRARREVRAWSTGCGLLACFISPSGNC